ncbi:MAG: MltA domain-containing protein [Acetobacteraceae bacterium]|nr:MltA domain-containing protein [Acetobacteraceae bacterium]
MRKARLGRWWSGAGFLVPGRQAFRLDAACGGEGRPAIGTLARLAGAAVVSVSVVFWSCLSAADEAPARPAPMPEGAQLREVGFRDIPGWPGEDAAQALTPFLGTCRGLPAWEAGGRPLGGTGELARLGGRPSAFVEACAEAERLVERLADPAASLDAGSVDATGRQGLLVSGFFERRFRAFAAGSGLMTGYYEPELRGAEYPVGPFQIPLHTAPPPLPGGARLPDRAAIETGALAGLGLELAWVDDPVDAFFLHVQGAGRLRLHDGRVLRVGYAGKNDHPYKAIGRVLLDAGAIPRERMSMQAIRAWLEAAPPGEAAALLRHNPSYVFFRVLDGLSAGEGPPGALGVPLTPGRSLAVDPAFIPFGAPVFAATRDPVDGAPIRRLMHAQDTGGAIRGAARGDLFWGWGEAAAIRAGLMREAAEVFVLVPREEPGVGARNPDAVEAALLPATQEAP